MKVVLLKNVQSLGKFGDVKEVALGYARNYLIPLGLAALAQSEIFAQIATVQKKEEKRKEEKKKSFEKLVEELQGKTFEISAKASSEGNLYAGVSAQKISLLLQSHGYMADASRIKADHIKALGEHTVKITLPHGKFVEITLMVNPHTLPPHQRGVGARKTRTLRQERRAFTQGVGVKEERK